MTRFWPEGEPITVDCERRGVPAGFRWCGYHHPVQTIFQHWRVDEDWWKGRIWRDYYLLSTTTGLLVILFHDLLTGNWYLQRLYD